MAGPASIASRPPTYSGTRSAILRRAVRRLTVVAAAFALGLPASGCAMSNFFGFGKNDAMASADITGSIPASRLPTGLPPEEDLVHARAAITEVLSMGRRDFSTSWENPKSGARGTVTPISSAYQQDGNRCHDFLASYIKGRQETWMQGEACQQEGGKWVVKALKPWKRG
jgi:surface antigen